MKFKLILIEVNLLLEGWNEVQLNRSLWRRRHRTDGRGNREDRGF